MTTSVAARSVLVTGGSKGIGLSCAEAFGVEGCAVIIVGRDDRALSLAMERVERAGARWVEAVRADLSNEVERDAVAGKFPDIDVLVNNAGSIPAGDLASIDSRTWRAAWDLKVFGYIDLTRHYLARMAGRGDGVIVNVIGSAGRAPRPNYVCGATANAALIAFTEAVGGGSPEFGVRVVGCNPGPTLTERLLGAPVTDVATDLDEVRRRLPRVRVAEPAAIAEVVKFLASDAARSLSGVVIDTDHGELRRERS